MKKTIYLLSIIILTSACNTSETTTNAPKAQTSVAPEPIASIDTVTKSDTIGTYEKLKENEKEMMKNILKKRKTL